MLTKRDGTLSPDNSARPMGMLFLNTVTQKLRARTGEQIAGHMSSNHRGDTNALDTTFLLLSIVIERIISSVSKNRNVFRTMNAFWPKVL